MLLRGRHLPRTPEARIERLPSRYSLDWEVRAEIAERYHARIAKEPTRHDFSAGDTVYVPTNTEHQHFNASRDTSLKLLSGHDRVFRYLGYDNVRHLEPAPEFETRSPRPF